MADRSFCHLHCHTHYSLLDGFNRIPELVKQTKKLGMNACAITDHGNLYGAIEFYTKCKDEGIKPIIGYEAYVAPGDRRERKKVEGNKSFHLTMLAKNEVGFRNLIKLSSIAFLEGFYYNPRIDKEILEAHSEGLIILSGCLAGELSDLILRERHDEAAELAKWYERVFGEDYYLEIQNNGLDLQDTCTQVVEDMAAKLGIPMVATADAHYLCAADAEPHDVLFCINTERKHNPNKRLYPEGRMPNPYYVRSPDDMYGLFPKHSQAVAMSQEIANKVDIQIDLKKRHFPVFQAPNKLSEDQYLRQLCEKGVYERYGETPSQAVWDRLGHELNIIQRMRYSAYFLIVWDFVRFAREQGIPCTARGSGCGAIVAYALYMSHVCPLEYDLLFERFLDPNRSEPPDIDIDFCQDRRELVIEYVKKKYGHESVAQIGTFGTLAAKAAMKDVGRALEVPLDRVNALCKLVPMKGAISLDLKDAMESPDFRREYDSDPQAKKLIDIAMKLEGLNRNVGTHAAGVVIANGPITDYVPVQRVVRKNDDKMGEKKDGEVSVTTQWEMGILEKVGMLKMDFLGLRNLTVLDNTVKLILRTRGETIDPLKFPLDDRATYQLLQKGDAKGVFQLESEGIRGLLQRMKPDNIRDLIAVLALYRPGPLGGGMVDSYVNRKLGRETWTYPHPVLKDILDETYGVMCIHEDTRIAMADGTEKPIKHVRRWDLVHSMNLDTREIEIKECHGCGPTRRGEGLKITLENGFAVTLTPDHQVRTWDGWVEAQDLDIENHIVAIGVETRPLPAEYPQIAPWLGTDDDVAYLFGQLVGDGCLTQCGVTIATGTKVNHTKLVGWLKERLPSLHVHEYHNVRSWYVNLSNPELLGDPTRGNRKTRLHALLESHDLKKKAIDKRVPEVIFRSPASVRAAFLAGLFDADGCFATTQKGHGVAFFTTASMELRNDFRRLLQLDGIIHTLYPQRVQIWNLERFREIVEPYLVVKQFPEVCTAGKSVGWVPFQELRANVLVGETHRAFGERTGIQRKVLTLKPQFVKSSLAFKAGIDLGDVRYIRIRSIESVDDQQFYGMSVQHHHNLIANGIVVKNCYQEQIMRILNRLGGIELSKAYACIKAISKKIHEKIDSARADFLTGCAANGVDDATATDIFDKIVFFAGYGFNKSHTAAYAQIGYQTAYLKAHYTAEFMAALLTSEIDDGAKRDVMVEHIADAKRLGVDVLPPNVNTDRADFDVNKHGQITFGLTAIKGLGRNAAVEIVNERDKNGRYKDLFDMCERVDSRVVSRAAVERMIKAGALDAFGKRAAMVLAVEKAFASAEQRMADKKRGQKSFFDMLEGSDEETNGSANHSPMGLNDTLEWPEREKLKFEKEALDFYISSHPLAQYDDQLRRFRTYTTAEAIKLPQGTTVVLAGMVTGFQVRTAQKSGKRWAMLQLEDFNGQAKCILWSEAYAQFKDVVVDDAIVLFEGAVEWRDGGTQGDVIVKRVLDVEQARREMCRVMLLRMNFSEDAETIQKFEGLKASLTRYRGNCPVHLSVRDRAGKVAELKLSKDLFIDPNKVIVDELEQILGRGNVIFTR